MIDHQAPLPHVKSEGPVAASSIESAELGDGQGDGCNDDQQLELFAGVKPGARWRRWDAEGAAVSWSTLDQQLRGIKKRRRRDGTWAPHLAAVATMENVRAQTYGVSELERLDVVCLPDWARGRWQLSPNEERLLGAVWAAYRDDTGGVFELQLTLSHYLGFSDRTLRNLLWGRKGKYPRPGLVERGLLRAEHTHREGTNGRKVDNDWVLLRIGPVFEEQALPVAFARGRKPPRRSGITRKGSQRARARARSERREDRYQRAGQLWRQRNEQPRERPEPSQGARSPAGSQAVDSLSVPSAAGEVRGENPPTKPEKFSENHPRQRARYTRSLSAVEGVRGKGPPQAPAGNELASLASPLTSPAAEGTDKLSTACDPAGDRAPALRPEQIARQWLEAQQLELAEAERVERARAARAPTKFGRLLEHDQVEDLEHYQVETRWCEACRGTRWGPAGPDTCALCCSARPTPRDST